MLYALFLGARLGVRLLRWAGRRRVGVPLPPVTRQGRRDSPANN
jgi:hypothetical protein